MTSGRYRLIAKDGRDLGPLVSSRADWPIGAMITGVAGDLRVTAVVEAEPGQDFQEYLVVEQLSLD
ncbi:MAG: hypothetical protein WAU41_11430 [Gaiellaceae bacterium]